MDKNVSMHDALCKLLSAHEPNHRLNGDKSLCFLKVQSRIFDILQQKIHKSTEAYSQPKLNDLSLFKQ